jgi:hypothetical protein
MAEAENLADFKARLTGRRVQYVGPLGNADGPVVKVERVTRGGVWVIMPDASRQQWHPEDVRVVPE